LQETSGADQNAIIALPNHSIIHAWETDLLEYDLRELPVEPDGTLRVTVPAWGLTTVRLEIAGALA
jgi:alpha-mannosidase